MRPASSLSSASSVSGDSGIFNSGSGGPGSASTKPINPTTLIRNSTQNLTPTTKMNGGGLLSDPSSPTQMELLQEAAMLALINSQFNKKLEAYKASGGNLLLLPPLDLPLGSSPTMSGTATTTSADHLLGSTVSRSLASAIGTPQVPFRGKMMMGPMPPGFGLPMPLFPPGSMSGDPLIPPPPQNQHHMNHMNNVQAPGDLRPNSADSFKTVMCNAWLQGFPCPFQENCRFAHGEHELREPKGGAPMTRPNTKWRTKLCDKYTKTGVCPYGAKCLFIHPDSGPNAYIRPDKINEITERQRRTAAAQASNNKSSGSSLSASASTLSLTSLIDGCYQLGGQKGQLTNSRSCSPLTGSTLDKSSWICDSGLGASPSSETTTTTASNHLFGASPMGGSIPPTSEALAPTPARRPPLTSILNLEHNGMFGEKSSLSGRSRLGPHPSWPLEPSSFFSPHIGMSEDKEGAENTNNMMGGLSASAPANTDSPLSEKKEAMKRPSTSSPLDVNKIPPLPDFFKGMLPSTRITPPRLHELSSELISGGNGSGFGSPLGGAMVDSPLFFSASHSTHSTDDYDFSHLIPDMAARFDTN